MAKKSYNKSVFINCPIDAKYSPLFRAIVFTVLRCNHHVRCAVEEDDASEIRLTKILRMIAECRLAIHDLSRTELDGKSHLPRFNMPFELGLFLAAKHFGCEEHARKACLVFEKKRHSYEAFISDIKGQDIVAHDNEPRTMVIRIRDWLASNSGTTPLKGGHAIWNEYVTFRRWLPPQCRRVDLKDSDLTFGDYVNLVYEWAEAQD
jgi:hypothetical protein